MRTVARLLLGPESHQFLTCCNGWDDVLAHKQAIPFWRFCGGVGRTAHAENRYSNGQGPLDLLKNVESNAEVCVLHCIKGLDVDALYISHILLAVVALL
ncbi:hypothetical protein HN51_011392 [Arachis hypogaea]